MRKIGMLLTFALMAGAGTVSAADYNWTTGTGNWTDAWDGGGYPATSSDRAFVLGGTQNLTPTYNPGTDLTAIEVKASAGGTTLNISENIRTANSFVMSWNNTGTATVNHSAGEFRSNGQLWVGGTGTASANIYNLSGTALLKSPNTVLIGRSNASGILNVTGGTYDVWGSGGTQLGEGTGSSGTVNLSAGLFKPSGGTFVVGNSGSGTVDQTGGKLWLNTNMILKNNTSASGTYTISGGEIDTTLGRWALLKDGSLFEVDGSGASSIELSRLDAAVGSVFRINLDAGGSTLVKASRTDAGQGVDIYGTLELDTIAGFNGVYGDTYDLFWAQTGNMDTNSMTFANLSGSTDFSLSIVSKDGGDMLQATVIPEPATLGLFAAFGGVALWIRRQLMI